MDIPKLFEALTKKILIAEGVCVDRLPDQMSGNLGSTNPGDFTAYKFPYLCYVECKSCQQESFDIKQHIMEGQWLACMKKANAHFPGVFVGYLIWFVNASSVFWVDASNMETLYKKEKVRSFTARDLEGAYSKYALKLESQQGEKDLFIENLFTSITSSKPDIEEAKETILNLVNAELDPAENVCATTDDIQYLGSVVQDGVVYYLLKALTFTDSYWAVSMCSFNVKKFDATEYLPFIQE